MTDDTFDFDRYDRVDMTPTVITDDMLRRRIVWDVVPCSMAQQVISLLGLPPASDEVEETEHQEAHARLEATGPIAQVLHSMSHRAAEAVHGAMMVSHGKDTVDESVALQVEALTPMLFQSVLAVFAELQDLDVVHFHGVMLQ